MGNTVSYANHFCSFIDANETQVMHTRSDNIEIMNGIDNSDAINELIDSFMERYQEEIETKMKGSSYIFERVDLFGYNLHKISLNRGRFAITAAMNYENINCHPEKICKLEPFINNYNWKDKEYPSHSKDMKKFEQIYKTITLNILYVPYSTNEIKQAYISKYSNKRDSQVNALMITDGTTNWHYLTIKNIPGLLRGITSNHDGDFYCLNCFHAYTTQRKLEKHERVCKDHDFCQIIFPDENNKVLKYNPREYSLKVPFIIYSELECVIQKINTCPNNPCKSYTEKKQSIYLQVIP